MKHKLRKAVTNCNTLEEVLNEVVRVFKDIKETSERIGFVSGIVTSDGPIHIQRNLLRLENFTQTLSQKTNFPLFSARCVFTDELYRVLDEGGAKNDDYLAFWDKLLRSGYVTDVFMTPRWEKSMGATNENKLANSLALKIHYVEEMVLVEQG